MKYSPHLYAKAFAEAGSRRLSPQEESALVRNLIALVKKNGDSHQLKKIAAYAERMLREKSGKRKVTVESARPLKAPPEKIFAQFLRASDILEKKIEPRLIAGIKITVNDAEQLDISLSRKLKKLFG